MSNNASETQIRLEFGLQKTALPADVAGRYVATQQDEVNERFLSAALAAPHGALKTWLHSTLCSFFSDFDVNGWLHMYPVHLLSAEQWKTLLPKDALGKSLLDVGAGNGDLTAELRDHFASTKVTEASSAMRGRLRKQGYTVFGTELKQVPGYGAFDVVSCLNVLDRTAKPLSLLGALADAVNPQGYVILAVPLPLRPFFYRGPLTFAPLEPLEAPGPRWESALLQLFKALRRARPTLELVSFTRAPYLSWGDAQCSLYALDDVVAVFRKTG